MGGDERISKPEKDVELVAAFWQSPEIGFAVPEEVFDDVVCLSDEDFHRGFDGFVLQAFRQSISCSIAAISPRFSCPA